MLRGLLLGALLCGFVMGCAKSNVPPPPQGAPIAPEVKVPEPGGIEIKLPPPPG